MTTTDEQYVPSEDNVRARYAFAGLPDYATSDQVARARDRGAPEFDRFLARVRRDAKAEVLREAAGSIDLDKIADEWSQGPGNRDDMHWAAGNAASSVVLALYDRAAEYETGDQR